ncbi:MAG TPA: type II secretion system protein [Trichocoleus sp.]
MARLLKSSRTDSSNSCDEGLTLIECLVAIVMVGLVMGTVTPALVISTATRLQSQRTEQALRVAQAEIDQVRTIVERGTYSVTDLPQSTTAAISETRTLPGTSRQYLIEYPDRVAGPNTSNLRGASTAYTGLGPFDARQVDIDGDGNADLAVQVYRSPGRRNPTSSVPVNFAMGVRVYDISAFETNSGTLLTDQTRGGITGGEGDRGRLPLAVLYTSISKGDAGNSYCDYFNYLGSTPSASFQCD